MVFYRQIIALIFLAVMAASCARMEVKVDILDPEYARSVKEEISHAALIRAARNNNTAFVDNTLENMCTAYLTGLMEMRETARQRQRELLAKPGVSAATRQSVTAVLDASAADDKADQQKAGLVGARNVQCVKQIDEASGTQVGFIDRDALLRHFRTMGCLDGSCEKVWTEEEAREKRLQAIGRYQGLLNYYGELIDRQLQKEEQNLRRHLRADRSPEGGKARAQLELERTAARQAAQGSSALTSYLGGNGQTLVLNDIAHAAVSADSDHWQVKFNKAEGFGAGGSTDMVVKLNDTADFSVKGLVFDARATAIATRKLTISSLQLLAAGAGRPITIEGKDEQGNPVTETLDANDEIVVAKANIDGHALQEKNYRAALKRIALSVLTTADEVQQPGVAPADRQDMRGRTAATFTANEPLLKATAGD